MSGIFSRDYDKLTTVRAIGGIGRRTTLKMWREIVRVRVSHRPCIYQSDHGLVLLHRLVISNGSY